VLGCCVCVHWITIDGTLDDLSLFHFCQGMNKYRCFYLQALGKIVLTLLLEGFV